MIPRHLQAGAAVLHHGDVLAVLRADVNGYPFALGYGPRLVPDASIDAIVTDPPYGLSNTDSRHVVDTLTAWLGGDRDYMPATAGGFMGAEWDSFVPPVAVWDECLRALKPGGHLVAFAGARTFDLMGIGVRLAGFEIRDGLAWLYGSGFPKSMDVATAVDKLDAAAVRRARALQFTAWMRSTGVTTAQLNAATGSQMGGHYLTDGEQPHIATPEVFDLLRPLLPAVPAVIEDLVADRVVESENWAAREITGQHGKPNAAQLWRANLTGGQVAPAREIRGKAATDAAREWEGWGTSLKPAFEPLVFARKPFKGTVAANVIEHGTGAINIDECRIPGGRFPANVLLDPTGAAEVDAQAPDAGGQGKASGPSLTAATAATAAYGARGGVEDTPFYGDAGGASRFFPQFSAPFRYEAKAPGSERPTITAEDGSTEQHSTVKPVDLMRWLCRLVTPPGGTVLDPFAGSGSTAEAALVEGFGVVMIERDDMHTRLIEKRIRRDLPATLFGDELDGEGAA